VTGTQSLYPENGTQIVELADPSFSARIASLAKADGLALLPAGDSEIRKGHLLELLPFRETVLAGETLWFLEFTLSNDGYRSLWDRE